MLRIENKATGLGSSESLVTYTLPDCRYGIARPTLATWVNASHAGCCPS